MCWRTPRRTWERDAMMAKAEYLIRIGDKEGALTAFRKTYDKTVALGHRLDIVFYLLRIGHFYMDSDPITCNWDRRNRLKVYQGLYCAAIKDFTQAAELFLDTVSTFTSYELMDYKTFVTYTIYVCMITLKRPDLREKEADEFNIHPNKHKIFTILHPELKQ
ncbi:26S proteasome non-ATPase regulatory subunit 6 [Collichthys lucidus]|uniref:26S proteasome non-ATPase regulatory subunit 6 n=1 Tax=Collichthys lucidus TaxID=240159 RepID=A0A4U5UF38_COLLU|nr:26S proteasome non-ATPase regulatory subunit 6 [Collichthys lucidus]